MYITIMFLHKHVTHMLIPDTLILDLDTQALRSSQVSFINRILVFGFCILAALNTFCLLLGVC